MVRFSIADRFVILAIWVLPYEFMFIPIPFTYRPASLLFLPVAFAIYFFESKTALKLNKPIKQMLMFILLSCSIGTVVLIFKTNSISCIKYYFPSISMGCLSMLTFAHFFSKHFHEKNFSMKILTLVGKAYVPVLLLGTIETLSCYHILPYVFKSLINAPFGGWQSSRPCLTMREASFAATHMCFIFPIYFYLSENVKKRWKLCAIWSLVLLLATVSTKGFMMFLMMMFAHPIIRMLAKGNVKVLIKNVFFVALALLILVPIVYQLLILNPDAYYTKRILNFTDIVTLISTDNSAFTRIGLPIISIRMFLDNPIFGLGCGGFFTESIFYIQKYMPFALSLREVQEFFYQGYSFASAILFQVMANFGIYGLLLFLLPLKNIWNQQKKILAENGGLTLFYSMLLILTIQNGNWGYMLFWFSFVFFSFPFLQNDTNNFSANRSRK